MQQRNRRLQRLRQWNRSQLGLILALVTLLFTLLFPRYFPAARNGPQCSDLAPPIGGNNRSILAHRSDQADALDLDIELAARTIGPNSPLEVTLTFVNRDRGPVILHIPDQDAILTNNPAVEGITLDITSVDLTVNVASQPGTYTPPAVFTGASFRTLHLLGARARCHETITISAQTLQNLGLVPGQDYRIRAFFRNSSAGNLPQANLQVGVVTATPFPEYTTQGVWTGTVSSEEVRFRISTTEPQPPAQ